MALGAGSRDVLRLILRQALVLTGLGVAIGLAGAVAATTVLRSMLFEIKTTDPLTYAGVTVLILLATLAASYIPARRALNLDPLAALRQE